MIDLLKSQQFAKISKKLIRDQQLPDVKLENWDGELRQDLCTAQATIVNRSVQMALEDY